MAQTFTAPRSILPDAGPVIERLRDEGYDVIDASAMRRLVEAAGGTDWDDYARSWDDLDPDRFMADGGTYRRRRFACFSATDGGVIALKPPQPHFQTRENNPLNGGVARVFAPVRPAIEAHPLNRAILRTCLDLFGEATSVARRPPAWHVEMHQFRIDAGRGALGRPTPEGLHRDGVDWVVVMMVRRENVEGGVSTIADAERRPIGSATLAAPFDATVLDDHRVLHGVSPIAPCDPSRPAFRDVLVMTFRADSAGA